MKSIMFIVLMVLSGSVMAETFKSENETKKFTDSLMSKTVKENFKQAFDSAKPYWPIPGIEVDNIVNNINKQWPIVHKRFGKSVSIEFLKKESIGKSFIQYIYLHKFEKHAVYWKVCFYKSKNEWAINMIVFSDNLNPLYE